MKKTWCSVEQKKRFKKLEFKGLSINQNHYETTKDEMIDKLRIKVCKKIIFQ